MGLANLLLTLPASRRLLALPKDQHAPLAAVMLQLREEAQQKIAQAAERRDTCNADFWRMVATFSTFVHRAFKREALRQDKTQLVADMLDQMGMDRRKRDVSRLIGLQSFTLPEVSSERCVLRADRLELAPWVELGDLIEVDFTASRIVSEGLYIVAIEGAYVAVRGFHQSGPKWFVHENSDGLPKRVSFRDEGGLQPDGFEILGRITAVYKPATRLGDKQ